MKRVNNIYDDILDLNKIQNMYDKRIKINTQNKKKLERFENNYVSNMTYIKQVLENKNYTPGRYNLFFVKEPKIRLIMSQNVIDKIINHLVSEYFLIKYFEKSLIDENVATRKNKGTSYGIKLVKKYLNEIKYKEFYILKFDISKYFFNLDHEIIKKQIRHKIKDKNVLELLDKIIDSTDAPYVNNEIKRLKYKELENIKEKNPSNSEELLKEIEKVPEYKIGKGLPIGNMSSQFLAILYLNELDHYIKEKLKVKYYIRYMDDGIIIHEDKEYLKYCLKEIKIILEKYRLELNDKTGIRSIKNGFEFLGFRYYIKNDKIVMKVKNQTKKRFKRKMKNLYKLESENRITIQELNQVKSSYMGHLGFGNTKNLIKKTLDPYTKEEYLFISQVEIIDGRIEHIKMIKEYIGRE